MTRYNSKQNIKKMFLYLILFGLFIIFLKLISSRFNIKTYPINLIQQLEFDNKLDHTSADLLLNIRKLVLFAVHELNELVSSTPSNPCGKTKTCPKWWANPLNTIDINTTPFLTYMEHNIIFIVDPGRIKFVAKIRQYQMNLKIEEKDFVELQIIGNFNCIIMNGKNATLIDAPIVPPVIIPPHKWDTYNKDDNAVDPELNTWKRHYSFMVGDYVDFNSPTLYKISPKNQEKNLVEHTYCGSSGLKMLIMVSSPPNNFENRKVIRETYGSHDNLVIKYVRLVFLFGKVKDQTLQTLLEEEATKYDDIIQGDFMDSYHNLTLSHLLMYNWIQRTCETIGLPRYILKANDDYFLNIDIILRIAYANPQHKLIGNLFCGTQPVRRGTRKMWKYLTPHYMYIPDYYVGYLSGVAYILRTDIIPNMLKISLTTPMIHMDDIYMTGLLARQINIVPSWSHLFVEVRVAPDPCITKKMACSKAIDVQDIRKHWKKWIKPIPRYCSLKDITKGLPIISLSVQENVICLFH